MNIIEPAAAPVPQSRSACRETQPAAASVSQTSQPPTGCCCGTIVPLCLTCGSSKSRNHALGVALARGEAAKDFLGARNTVAEGAYTAAATMAIAQKKEIDLPICEAIDAVINKGVGLDEAIEALLNRPLRAETG